jgi:hypothetical protein
MLAYPIIYIHPAASSSAKVSLTNAAITAAAGRIPGWPSIQMYTSITTPTYSIAKGPTIVTCTSTVTVTQSGTKSPLPLSGASVTVQWTAASVTAGFPVTATLTTGKQGTATFVRGGYPKVAGGCGVQVTDVVKSGCWYNSLPVAVATTWPV